MIQQLLGHRLKQADIKRLLDSLGERDREEFLSKISDILGKVTALLEVANRVSDTLSLDTLLTRMMEITSEAISADRSTLFLNDAETHELFSRVAQGELTTEIRFPNHLGIAGSVYTTGEAVIIPDAYADPRFNPAVDKKTGYQTRNILCAPLRTRDRSIIGVTQLLNKLEDSFNEDDLAILEAITSQASAALLNAQLFEQVERARQDESQLLEVTAAISSELKLGPLLQKIMETTTDILEADRSTLFLHDDKRSELWSEVAQGVETKEIRFPDHLGIAGSVYTTGQTVNIPDAYADSRFNPEVDKKTGYKTRSILCMPVVNKEGRTIGVTQVLNKKGGPFARLDEKRLAAFSAQASIAIENAKLFDEVLTMKNYNESMLESMSNGVLTLDEEAHIAKCNAPLTTILGIEEAELIGRPALEVFTGPNAWVWESVTKVITSGGPDIVFDTELQTADGQQASLNLTVVPLVGVEEESIGTMLVFEDITQEKRLKGTMARYMTKEVAEKLLESGEDALGGQEQEAAVLFSDIRSFTTISEAIGAQETVSMLNEYFTIMVDVIFNHGGILDKYIGDAIMAVFGAPFSSEEDSDRAVRAGVEMLRALHEFNQRRVAAGQDPIDIGIGVSTDIIVTGNIGSPKRMDYTVIGDGVNLASRLEGANKFYGTKLLISESCQSRLSGEYLSREIDLLRVKGKTRPVAVYEILDHYAKESFPCLEDVLGRYNRGLELYRGREFSAAADEFEAALALNPDDTASNLYIERSRYFLSDPPSEDWDGIWVMKSK
ncbi:MAG: GAF domain-containing protein [Deltaproteobacteria bacterium]|nr:GAF domain-containing protein [Deltaproteobacteria bacterium]